MADEDLEALVRRVDLARWLATRLIPDPVARGDVIALHAFDHELGRAERVASTPLMAEIRLAWWREALDEAFADRPVRAHPTARRLAEAIGRHGLERAPLEAMIDAHVAVLGREGLDGPEADAWARGVGGSSAVLAARMLDPVAPADAALPAGRVWGLTMLARSGRASPIDPGAALREAAAHARRLSPRAFPAVVHATLARSPAGAGPLSQRLRLLAAAARGRL